MQKKPRVVVGDRAYDSDSHDVRLQTSNLLLLIRKIDAKNQLKILGKSKNIINNDGV